MVSEGGPTGLADRHGRQRGIIQQRVTVELTAAVESAVRGSKLRPMPHARTGDSVRTHAAARPIANGRTGRGSCSWTRGASSRSPKSWIQTWQRYADGLRGEAIRDLPRQYCLRIETDLSRDSLVLDVVILCLD